jgi:hypothetical protein
MSVLHNVTHATFHQCPYCGAENARAYSGFAWKFCPRHETSGEELLAGYRAAQMVPYAAV